MKFIPQSIAAGTAERASFTSTLRNSAPKEEAPKLTTDRSKSVFPSRRVFIEKCSLAASPYERQCEATD